MRRLRTSKYLLALSYIIILYTFESAIVDWTSGLLFQATILNIALLLGIYAFRGFDNSNLQSLNSSLVSYSIGSLIGALFSLMFVAFFKTKLPKEIFITSLALSGMIFPIISTYTMRKVLSLIPPKRYLIIGKESEIGEIIREVEKTSMGKIKVYGYMNPSSAALEKALSLSLFDSILVADQKLSRTVEFVLENAHQKGKSVEFLPLIVEQTLKRIPIELIDKFKEYYEIEFSKVSISPAKKVFDIIFALIGIIIGSPIMAVLAIAILIESGHPILFKQKRIGINMKPFTFIKFRSLKNLNETELEKLNNPNATIKQRVTKIGKLMRKFRIDELPQFFNVLNGTMSVIGPRPEMPAYHNQCLKNIPYYSLRYKMKPGITGWAQINYKHTSGLEDYKIKTEYDLYYIKNRSIFLDLQITLRTIETMLGMRGAK